MVKGLPKNLYSAITPLDSIKTPKIMKGRAAKPILQKQNVTLFFFYDSPFMIYDEASQNNLDTFIVFYFSFLFVSVGK